MFCHLNHLNRRDCMIAAWKLRQNVNNRGPHGKISSVGWDMQNGSDMIGHFPSSDISEKDLFKK